MELLQLRYFLESARNESFAKTAEKYMVPPTSVSASVKRLENELGCQLFHRSCNKISLNDNGRKLQQSLKEIFNELDSVVDSLTSASTDTREIRMLVRAMRETVTDHIIEYKTKHSNIAFKTVFDFDDIDFEDYDIIIDEKSNNYPEYEKIELYTTILRLRASNKSPLCKRKLALKQLAGEPFISIGENNGMHKILINACRKEGFVPNIIVKSNDLQCNRKFVEAGVGIGLAREYDGSKSKEKTEILNVVDFNEQQTICAYYKKSSDYGNVNHFLNFLKRKANGSNL